MTDETLIRPGYDPGQRQAGVAHLGVGNFHRAHQAVYFDDLLARDDAAGWGIAGVNLMPGGELLGQQLKARDMRYVLKTIASSGEFVYREIASLLQFHDRPTQPAGVDELLADPKVQLVTMTVTGAGYYLGADDELDLQAAPIAAELAGEKGGSLYGALRAGLNARRQAGAGPVTLLCCDNMRDNGEMLRKGLDCYLEAIGDTELAAWLADNVSFPSSVVDRITPVTPPDLAAEVEDKFGIANDPALMAESFIQWVIDDNFAGQRPPLDQVGVKFVPSAHDYEEAKIRVLNGGHSAIAYLAALRGHEYVWQAMQDPELVAHFERYQLEEVIPAAASASNGHGDIDLVSYMKTIKDRFSSPYLDDTIARICRRGTSKIPEFVLPTIAGTLARGEIPSNSIEVVAAWYVVMRKCADGNGPISYDDTGIDMVKPCLRPGGEREFAEHPQLWGDLSSRYPQFADSLVERIDQMVQGRN